MENMLIAICIDLEIFSVIKRSHEFWKGKDFYNIALAEQKRFWKHLCIY